jgi:hypothetical protein
VYLTNLRPTERGQTGQRPGAHEFTREMTFIGPLMMYDNFSVTVYGALDHAIYKTLVAPPPATLDLPVSMVVRFLGEPKQSGLALI